MNTDSTHSDAYEVVLADLRAKREQIDQTIQMLEALRSGSASPTQVGTFGSARIGPDPNDEAGLFLGMTIPDASKKLLAMRKRTMGNADIARELQIGGLVMTSADPVNTIGSVLTRRFNQVGDIVRVSRGLWGLKEWYPNRNFKKGAPDAPKNETSEPEQPSELTVEEMME